MECLGCLIDADLVGERRLSLEVAVTELADFNDFDLASII